MSSVYIKTIGGLGNQLFQVAAGASYAYATAKGFYIDDSQWFGHQGVSCAEYKHNIFQNFKYKESPTENCYTLKEKKFNHSIIPYYKEDVILSGYFQSLKYFTDYPQEFKNTLVFPKVKTDFLDKNNVAFHIRRGDYLQFRNVHYVCDTEYFDKCFDMFKGYQINVFTDSPEYVLEEFKHQEFNLIQTSSELNDLTLMSLHDNMVISNSSFSWWASFLGKKKERIISPSKWFADGREATDIFRDEFIRI